MRTHPILVAANELQAGDVILFPGEGPLANKVHQNTTSLYTHAAICISNTELAELCFEGLSVSEIENAISGFKHCAVFRNPYCWSENQVVRLQQFVQGIKESGSKYNRNGVKKFVETKREHEMLSLAKLHDYAEGNFSPTSPEKSEYFCSEFVVDCFIAAEIISESASVAFQSNTYSPGDIGRESVFGYFLGYIKIDSNHVIPVEDEFFNDTTFKEISES